MAVEVTQRLRGAIVAGNPMELAARESGLREQRRSGVLCGMCGIEPAVVGLAALRSIGMTEGVELAEATSADCGGPSARTVGYLAVAYR